MGKHLTKEEYINKLSIVNPNVELIGDFLGVSKKTIHRCKIDNFEWPAHPRVLLRGGGCPMCGRIKIGQALRKTHQQYVEEVNAINPNIRVAETYIKDGEPLLHECLICSFQWPVTPSNILQGQGCPVCGRIL